MKVNEAFKAGATNSLCLHKTVLQHTVIPYPDEHIRYSAESEVFDEKRTVNSKKESHQRDIRV